MRFYGLALLASAAVIGACGGGGEDKATTSDSAATASSTPAAATTAGDSGATASSATAAPITGQTHEVKMVGDEKGYRFEPDSLVIKQGDGVKFVMVSGGPHNVTFDPSNLPAATKAQLSANMPQQISELSSPMMMNPNEAYTVSFGKIPPGTYAFHCTPHLAMGMKGKITVQ
ncbi:MAG TPA: plastocyanin/azurin family copper-binding protein [Gemmatimonadaceae bacterium]|nr:plastocyanin/azurin family copper-binding protein [Gemmatimonadaceae bacterium]